MSMSKEAYLKQITTENPSVVGMLKSGYYEVVECDCKQHHCRWWITRFSEAYVRKKNTQFYNPELVTPLTNAARAVKKKG